MAPEGPDWKVRIGQRIKLRDLHILSSVVQLGSMAKAATELSISQPAVSEAIARLEDALGVRLLDRSTRGIEPTIFARALLKRGLVVFDELRQGIQDIEFLAKRTAGEVRIGCPESLLAGLIPAVIDRLSDGYPQVTVNVVSMHTGTPELRELRERDVDLVLGRLSEPLAVDEEFHAEMLFDERYFVVVGARSRWARRRALALADLVNERWIHMPKNSSPGSLIAEAFQAEGLDLPRESVTTYSMILRNRLLATGHFLTIMPGSMLQFTQGLKVLPIDLQTRKRTFAVITLKNRTLSHVVELFVDHVRAVAKTIGTTARARRET